MDLYLYRWLQNEYGKYRCHKSFMEFLIVSNLKSRNESFKRAVILVKTRSAIEGIALQHYSESVMKIKYY